ncbi:MAG: two-component system, OmpR family, copper resistance phosphate regulon response regulator CusR [Parcubacteria group bacterium Gr01-1014_56]|nr:MAG: two-component system, OmpR family, copper resistance phosphate regulon response regulator CusR [Parcubacteria group bacterium Gr01-1014_56]
MRLLIVEDEEKLAQALKKGLEVKGYAVDWLADSEKALNRILMYRKEYDLIILDLMLPGIDGAAITERVRQENVTTPIIILTARNETEHKVDLLNKGADDYVVKPFSFDELIARINSVLRRPTLTKPLILHVGDVEMNTSTHTVTKAGQEVPLTLKEFALLECFMRQPNEVLTRERLFDHVWDFNALAWSNVLDVHMKNLRKKLEHEQTDERLFETVRGVGYRIAGEVQE